MSGIIWLLIPLTAIVGAYIIDYQKNKLKWQSKNSQQAEEVDELRKMVLQMKKRIENLEAIAVEEPSGFSDSRDKTFGRIEIDHEDLKTENEKNVANMAKIKGD